MSILPTPSTETAITVVLVDDSAVVRGMMGRLIESDPEIKVLASVSNGELGIGAAARHNPDIVILDVEMPIMDGLTALPKILEASPGVRVIMCSTLTVRNADTTIKALSLGATECIAKPTNSTQIYSADDFKRDVIHIIKALGKRRTAPRSTQSSSAATPARLPANTFTGGVKNKTPFELRKHLPGEIFRPQVLAVGSSTGGPQALFTFLANFQNFSFPIIVTQHMPPTFTQILAQHIGQQTGIPAFEGAEGMVVENGKIYVAPGGKHMTFQKNGTQTLIRLNDGPPENFCKPSVDPMLRSALQVWGGKIMTAILTGMGSDGLPGSKLVVEAGGRVAAQDQETSVVWGMPGAVATNGLCTNVLPLQELGPWVRQSFVKV